MVTGSPAAPTPTPTHTDLSGALYFYRVASEDADGQGSGAIFHAISTRSFLCLNGKSCDKQKNTSPPDPPRTGLC